MFLEWLLHFGIAKTTEETVLSAYSPASTDALFSTYAPSQFTALTRSGGAQNENFALPNK